MVEQNEQCSYDSVFAPPGVPRTITRWRADVAPLSFVIQLCGGLIYFWPLCFIERGPFVACPTSSDARDSIQQTLCLHPEGNATAWPGGGRDMVNLMGNKDEVILRLAFLISLVGLRFFVLSSRVQLIYFQ